MNTNNDSDTEIDETCSICIEKIKMKYKLDCGHSFCYLCLKFSLLGRTLSCPLCRSNVPNDILENATYNTSNDINTNNNDNNYNNYNNNNNNKQSQKVAWFYAGRNAGYWEYDSITTQLLEESYQTWFQNQSSNNVDNNSNFNPNDYDEDELEEQGLIAVAIADINTFYFNFKEMYQYNHRNGAIRKIKRFSDIRDVNIPVKGIAGLRHT